MNHDYPDIRIGACVDAKAAPGKTIRQLITHGFESFAMTFWGGIGDLDLGEFRDEIRSAIDGSSAVISALTLFGNPLEQDEAAEFARSDWQRLIALAPELDAPLVTGFTGALRGRPIPDSIPRLKEVYRPLLDAAGERHVRIAFENCVMGGSWKSAGINLAFLPEAFELLFEALPDDAVGLEWEPAHLIKQGIDPIENLIAWRHRIFHLHGKDGLVRQEVLRRTGMLGSEPWFWQRYPGFGSSDWRRIIDEMRFIGYTGTIDIEGYHDPILQGPREMEGMLGAFDYLTTCRGRRA